MWLLGSLLVGAVILLVVASTLLYNRRGKPKKRQFNYSDEQQQKIVGLLSQALPVHPSSGWNLQGTQDGIRVFARQLDSLQQYSSKQVFAASLIMDMSLKRALALISSVKELPSWFFGLPCSNCSPPSLVKPLSKSAHVIQFTMVAHPPQGLVETTLSKLQGWLMYLPLTEGLVSTPSKIHTEMVERSWHLQNESLGYLFTQPRFPSQLPYLWTCTFFSSLKQPGVCLATVVMSPGPGAEVAPLITGQLSAFREHITMRNFKVYSRFQTKSSKLKPLGQDGGEGTTTSSVTTSSGGATSASGGSDAGSSADGGGRGAEGESVEQSGAGVEPRQPVEKDSIQETTSSGDFNRETSSSFQTTSASFQLESGSSGAEQTPLMAAGALSSVTSEPIQATPLSPREALNQSYLSRAKEFTDKLASIADEGVEDGWLDVGTTKNIHVLKKLPADNEPPINSVKGTGVVEAPPEFLLRILQDPVHTATLDDLLKEMRVVEELSPAVTLVQLLYKAVWPTSPRDFAVLSVAGQVNETTWISSGNSVLDDRIPPEKGYVRADLLGGGYVIHSMSNNPNKSIVTYAACVNLKGSIPAFAVNKIAESQPMCIHNLRKLAEPLYKKMSGDAQAMADFEAKLPIFMVCEEEKKEVPDPSKTSPSADVSNTEAPVHQEVEEVGVAMSTTAQPMLQERLVQSQWHFDPSLPPVSTTEAQSGQEEGATNSLIASLGADETQHRFQTPPADSDQEQEVTDTKPTITPSISSQTSGLDKGDSSPDPTTPSSLPAQGSTTPSSLPAQESLDLSTTSSTDSRPRTSSGGPGDRAALQLSQYTPSNGHPPGQGTDSHYQSITRENIHYPRHDSGQVDYRTLANQTAARVLEETFHVSSLDLLDSSTFTDALTGGWSYAGFEKEVLLLSKTTPDQPFSSFMGKGIIPLSPTYIFNSLRNPQLRFMYDNMLKELHIVRHIEEGLFILHLHHETTQCFIKQARDFCILVSERSEPNKKLLTGFSIETADCPPRQNMHRGKVHCSGWVVEPKQVKGKLCSEVTYLLQVDFGKVPGALVNLISKRQPLAVAYLRDYLVSTSLEQSGQLDSN